MLLMLRRGWPGSFRRSVRDEKGEIVRTVEFQSNEPQEIKPEEMPFFANDIGNALVAVKEDDGRIRVIEDEPGEDASDESKPRTERKPRKRG